LTLPKLAPIFAIDLCDDGCGRTALEAREVGLPSKQIEAVVLDETTKLPEMEKVKRRN
jgi:hypothetical protein